MIDDENGSEVGSWRSWARHVLIYEEKTDRWRSSVDKKLRDIELEMATARGRAGALGAVAGVVGAIIVTLVSRMIGN